MSLISVLEHLKSLEKPVLRFAPNPNGSPTLGHLKGLILLNYLKTETHGNLLLRFDDTDLNELYQDSYYEQFLDLAKNLNITFDQVYSTSERRTYYLKEIKRLWDLKKIFFCFCDKNLSKYHQQTCACIELENLDFETTLASTTCMKFKSTVSLPYVVYRKQKDTWTPTIALQGPIDDYYSGVNVVIRGRDLESLEVRQREIHQTLYSTPYPITYYWGRITLWNSKSGKQWALSKSILKDTSKFPSLKFFAKWGFTYSSLSSFLFSYGFTKNDIKLDLIKLVNFLLKECKTKSQALKINSFGYVCWKEKDWKTKGKTYGYKIGSKILRYSDLKFINLK